MSKAGRIKFLQDEIEKLKMSKLDNKLLLDLEDRVKASYLMDIIEDGQPINVPKTKSNQGGSIQKSGIDNV